MSQCSCNNQPQYPRQTTSFQSRQNVRPVSCPRNSLGGRYTYTRTPNNTPQIGWHGRHQGRNYFNYLTNGSYAGRNRHPVRPCSRGSLGYRPSRCSHK